ncbi:hypothetical protein SEA_KRADAL_184 [Streptomyces phage Kradal]|nr:hypothetical protein SEA_KRADAL_184 [Streptomyces phage Kradal]QPL14500.1 hypothetical protein SEA_EHYELIMAYOE_185 [Streptomyces phage EhyElimayoE]
MITGEFIGVDDLGPLGRLAEKGEMLVLDPNEKQMVVAEREWIAMKLREAERYSRAFRKRLATAHMSNKRDDVREMVDGWELEIAKYHVCDHWLLQVLGKLESGQQMAMNVPKDFSYDGYGPVRELRRKVLDATDQEMINGARFRVQ